MKDYSQFHKMFVKMLRSSQILQRSSNVHNDIDKIKNNFLFGVTVVLYPVVFTNQLVNNAFDLLLLIHGPIRGFVYKPACEFQHELLNFKTKFGAFWQKFCEIECNVREGLMICATLVNMENNLFIFNEFYISFLSSVVSSKGKQLMVASQLCVVKHLELPLVLRSPRSRVSRLSTLMQRRNVSLMQTPGTSQVHLVSCTPRRKLMVVNDGRVTAW
jgi:hypothetical protein